MEHNIDFNNHQAAKEYTSFVTPDTLRQFLQFQKKFYELHTKKNNGYVDMNGAQYSGIIENYGNDMLIESRKLLLDKPPINNLVIDNDFSYYFNFQYSDCIDTYNLQSLIEASLKEDVFLSNKTYRIRFQEFETKVVLRSESTSDSNVHRVNLISTKVPPTLIIDNEEISLRVQDHCYSIAQAFLLFKKENTQYPSETDEEYHRRFNMLLPIYLPQTKAEIIYYFYMDINDDIIDSNDGKVLLTNELTNKWKNRPLIWFNSTTHQTLPDLEMYNNQDLNGNNIFEVGTDGHHKSFLYPISHDINDISGLTESNINEWYIKAVLSVERYQYHIDNNQNISFVPEVFEIPIEKISLIQPDKIERVIEFNGDFRKIVLCQGLSMDAKNYNEDKKTIDIYIPLLFFKDNILSNKHIPLKPVFQVIFNHKFLYDTEIISGNAKSGLHVGISSDYSDNGIIKKNGIIHHLGEFDGLPEYFKELLPRKITEKTPDLPEYEILTKDGKPIERSLYRAHVEAFSIRDVATDKNKNVFDKQIAALLIDGGIPQIMLPEFLKELSMTIVYNNDYDNMKDYGAYQMPEGIWLGFRTNPLYSWEIVDNGTGYQINDEFEFKIGDTQIHGHIRDIDDEGNITYNLIFIPDEGFIPTTALCNRITEWETTNRFKVRCPVCRLGKTEDLDTDLSKCPMCGAALERSNAEGLKLQLTIHEYLWSVLQKDEEAIADLYKGYLYKTIARSESLQNWLSEITFMGYTDNEEFENIANFGNCNIEGQENLEKFYFHQRRTFSTQPFGHNDQDLEAARVFHISNDTTEYINNNLATIQDKKSGRTMARICDIPTSWLQMIGIKKTYPSAIIDIYYIRQMASYTHELQEMVWNLLNRKWAWKSDSSNKIIIPRIFNKDDKLSSIKFLEEFYPKRVNFNESIDFMDPDITFEVYHHGEKYQVGDIFKFFISGNTIQGIIKEISGDGEVVEVNIIYPSDQLFINIHNLFEHGTVTETIKETGRGKGLSVLIKIDPIKWNSLQPKNDGVQDGLFTFQFDKRDNLWIWEYNKNTGEWDNPLRITGEDVDENEYDDDKDYMTRTVRSTYLHHLLASHNELSRIGDESLQLQGLKVRWVFKEIGFNRNVSINENIFLQYRDNVLVSNESSNPKHYMMNVYSDNDKVNWWNQHKPTSDSTWCFNFEIPAINGSIKCQYTFTEDRVNANLQTINIRILNPYEYIIDRNLFKNNSTILVNSTRIDNGVKGPQISITLSNDYYIWLFASFGCFELENIERASFEIKEKITEPTTFKFTIKSPTTFKEYPIIVKYILNDNKEIEGPIYIADFGEEINKMLNTEKGRDILRGTVVDDVIVFDAIKSGIKHSYPSEKLSDQWNQFEPGEGWGNGPNVHLNIDEHHYDRIIPQVRHTVINPRKESTVTIDHNIEGREDHSTEIKGMNKQYSLYFLTPAKEGEENHGIIEFEFYDYSNKKTWNWQDPGLLLLPQFHKLNLPEYYNRTNMLVYTSFNSHMNDEPYSKNVQPLMSIFNPTKSMLRYNDRISTDIVYITDEDEITFANTVDNQLGVLNLDLQDAKYCGRLTTNCYSYDECEELLEIKQLRLTLESMPRGNIVTPDKQICPETKEFAVYCKCEYCKELSTQYGFTQNGLIQYILEKFGPTSHPIRSEGTSYAYSNQMLIDYIISNTITDPSYMKDDIHLFRKRCERVVGYNYQTDKWLGIGPQPTGGYDVINIKQHNPAVTVRNKDYVLPDYDFADIVYTFQFDTFPSASTLKHFRMYANDFDISQQTLLIFGANMWVMWEGNWRSIYFESDFNPDYPKDCEKDCEDEIFN